MTRRDYIRLAAAINRARQEGVYSVTFQAAVDLTMSAIADELAAENPRFDRGRFYAACGARLDGEAA